MNYSSIALESEGQKDECDLPATWCFGDGLFGLSGSAEHKPDVWIRVLSNRGIEATPERDAVVMKTLEGGSGRSRARGINTGGAARTEPPIRSQAEATRATSSINVEVLRGLLKEYRRMDDCNGPSGHELLQGAGAQAFETFAVKS